MPAEKKQVSEDSKNTQNYTEQIYKPKSKDEHKPIPKDKNATQPKK